MMLTFRCTSLAIVPVMDGPPDIAVELENADGKIRVTLPHDEGKQLEFDHEYYVSFTKKGPTEP